MGRAWYGSNKPKTTNKIALMDASIISGMPGLTVNGGALAASAAIPADTSAQYQITTAAAETNTLAIPDSEGLVISLYMKTRAVGDRVITVASAINQAGNTIMTFGADGDHIILVGIHNGTALQWSVLMNNGVALT